MLKESIKVIGKVRLQVFDGDKCIQDTGFQENLVTNAGKAAIAGLVGNTGAITAFSYLALGTSATAAAVTDTTLGAEITDTGLGRSVATASRTTTSVTNDTLNFTYTWTATGVKVIAEIGILNASSVGILLAHKILSSTVTTANGNTIIGTYTVQFT